jgi:hypothetical protein
LTYRLPRYARDNPLLVLFIVVAFGLRLTFWLYTGRTFEDALITLTPARNAWEGFGLTHHASEPRVHSFTSPVGVLIPLAGESIRQGLLLMKLASLFASIPTIYYAYRIGEVVRFHWTAQVLVGSYLATDQLQIFFGMSGMETQIATAVALANAYYFLTSQWWKLGLTAGLGLLCRPEFIFWIPILGLWLILFERAALLPVIASAAAVALPWYVFATVYYGSPVPHTIVAKSSSFRIGFLSATWPEIWRYFLESWQSFAPFREFWFTFKAPVPDGVLKATAAIVIGLALIGVGRSISQNRRMLAVAAFLLAFIVYRTGSALPTYFMWYLPPFLALLFVFAGYGLSFIAAYAAPAAAVLSFGLAIAYAMHIPFSFPLDRRMQTDVEEAVRLKTGQRLNALMGPDDTAVLEPLGYLGWAARNKTIYDMPGLGSRVSVEALKSRRPAHLPDLIDALKPNFIVLRPQELNRFRDRYAETASFYTEVDRIRARPDLKLSRWGYSYKVADGEFLILQRD